MTGKKKKLVSHLHRTNRMFKTRMIGAWKTEIGKPHLFDIAKTIEPLRA